MQASLLVLFALAATAAATVAKPRQLHNPAELAAALSVLKDRHNAMRASATCSTTDQAKVKQCADKYFEAFGVDPAHMPAYLEFWANVEIILTQFGFAGMNIVCSYIDAYSTCLGTLKNNTACVSVEAFAKMYNFDEQNSSEYASDFQMRDYECKHKDVVYNNYECLTDITEHHIDEVDACRIGIVTDIANGVETCQIFNDYMVCMDSIYNARCGQQVMGLVCNVMQIMINFNIGDDTCKGKFPVCPVL